MSVLVTGGAGYIGSHTCVELLEAGLDIIVVDNLCNSKKVALDRVKEISGNDFTFYEANICDKTALTNIFNENTIDAVIHFAGLKAVGESCKIPYRYFQNNVSGTLTLCEVMDEHQVPIILFSSSATVYGDPNSVPIFEDFPTAATNPYGRSKLMVEEILRDRCKVEGSTLKAALLRYFNPIGAHKSGRIGEDPNGTPNNLLPYVAQVAVGKLPKVSVFGSDYPTKDGTGIRDYIHVVDLAKGHVKALQKMLAAKAGCYTFNLGTGQGYSVLDIINTFGEISERPIPYDLCPRRPGDIAECFADATLAKEQLDWQAQLNLHDMISDTWHWQQNNPEGYDEH